MIRSLFFFCAFLVTVIALQCKTGTYVVLDGTPVDKTKIASCNTTMCLKEKIYISGETGHNLQVVRFDCDYQNTCQTFKLMNLTNDNTCTNLKDLWVGNVCCCQTDKCNVDRTMSAGRLGALPVLISFFFSFLF